MSEGLERFVQLRPTHRQIDLGLFQRRIGARRFLCTHAFKRCLHRVERRHFRGGYGKGALRASLAFSEFLLFLTLQASIALFKAAPCMVAFEGASPLLFKAEGQAPDNRQYRGQR
ncbi:hypothetical protein D3C85_1598300 [compost metagenome]